MCVCFVVEFVENNEVMRGGGLKNVSCFGDFDYEGRFVGEKIVVGVCVGVYGIVESECKGGSGNEGVDLGEEDGESNCVNKR